MSEQLILTLNDDGTVSAGLWGEGGMKLVTNSGCWPEATTLQRTFAGRTFLIEIRSCAARPMKLPPECAL